MVAGGAADGPTAATPRPAKARAGRSHSTLRALLKEAEKDLARLEGMRQRLEADVAEAAGGSDHMGLQRLGAELATVHTDLAAAEERWLAVSEELEAR